jgi:hypothetical protein
MSQQINYKGIVILTKKWKMQQSKYSTYTITNENVTAG